jgi:hypothetical protein
MLARGLTVAILAVAVGCEDAPQAPKGAGQGLGVALDLNVDQPGGFSSLQLPAVDSTHIYADVAGGGPIVAIDHRTGLRSWEYAREPIAPSNLVRHGDGLFFVGSFAVAILNTSHERSRRTRNRERECCSKR